MWIDAETGDDYINFRTVADSVVELIEQAKGRPLSIGVSGDWGTGKSSLMKLTRAELERRDAERHGDDDPPNYVFVEFNAWLYQGYDDARAALLEAIATKLTEVAAERKSGIEKTKEFLARVNWFRLGGLVGGSALALALGLPPIGLIGSATSVVKRSREKIDEVVIEDGKKTLGELGAAANGLLKEAEDEETPRQKIEALRKSFEEALCELKVTLVVLIDDLDRCLPETAVSTLEAIRLFLFLEGTAFVIAADDQMIRHAVKKHFDQPDDDIVTNYFDKLIQVPIRVPKLGTQEVRSYMFMLYVEDSELDDARKAAISAAIADQLRQSWTGARVDSAFVQELGPLPPTLVSQLNTAERLTALMTTGPQISGNPRLVKRFMNSIAIRMAVAKRQGIAVDERVLAKLLLFERLAPKSLYDELAAAIANSADGRPAFLGPMEVALSNVPASAADDQPESTQPAVGSGDDPSSRGAAPAVSTDAPRGVNEAADADEHANKNGEASAAPAETPQPPKPTFDDVVTPGWEITFARQWLALSPPLAGIDMRGAMYVSREHVPVVTRDPEMSAKATELLAALVTHPRSAPDSRDALATLAPTDLRLMLDRLLDLAAQEKNWGAPHIARPAIEVARVAPNLGPTLAAFFMRLPVSTLLPSVIPFVKDEPWAAAVLAHWNADADVAPNVRKAIAAVGPN